MGVGWSPESCRSCAGGSSSAPPAPLPGGLSTPRTPCGQPWAPDRFAPCVPGQCCLRGHLGCSAGAQIWGWRVPGAKVNLVLVAVVLVQARSILPPVLMCNSSSAGLEDHPCSCYGARSPDPATSPPPEECVVLGTASVLRCPFFQAG